MMEDNWHNRCFYRVSVKALIRDQAGAILMVGEKDGDFALPGGGLDYGESLQACLKRELKEEIALSGPFSERVITALPVYSPVKQAWLMWVVCEVACDLDSIGVGEEAEWVEWVKPENIDRSTRAGQLIDQTLAALGEVYGE